MGPREAERFWNESWELAGASWQGRWLAQPRKTPVRKRMTLSPSDGSFCGGLRRVFQRNLLNNYKILKIWGCFFLIMKIRKAKVDLFIIQSIEIRNYTNRWHVLEPFLKTRISGLLGSYSLIKCKHIQASPNQPWGNIWGSKLEKRSCESREAEKLLAHTLWPHQSFFRS